jgi:hypothetical protein
MMAAAAAPCKNLLHVVSKNKAYFSVQGHGNMKVGEEHTHF